MQSCMSSCGLELGIRILTIYSDVNPLGDKIADQQLWHVKPRMHNMGTERLSDSRASTWKTTS